MNIRTIGGYGLMMVWSARLAYSGTELTLGAALVTAGLITLLLRAFK